jgi:hypothetical protein
MTTEFDQFCDAIEAGGMTAAERKEANRAARIAYWTELQEKYPPTWGIDIDPDEPLPEGCESAVIDFVWGWKDGSLTEPSTYAVLVDGLTTVGEAWHRLEVLVRSIHEEGGIETRHYFLEGVVRADSKNGAVHIAMVWGT